MKKPITIRLKVTDLARLAIYLDKTGNPPRSLASIPTKIVEEKLLSPELLALSPELTPVEAERLLFERGLVFNKELEF